tara:strand:- start:896 stop:1291 length:396 start_codon:yes stop_codon:yes gene_type:complete
MFAAEWGEVDASEVMSGRRYPRLLEPRRVVFFVLTTKFGWSKSEVSRWFGLDHTTVINSLRGIKPDHRVAADWVFGQIKSSATRMLQFEWDELRGEYEFAFVNPFDDVRYESSELSPALVYELVRFLDGVK